MGRPVTVTADVYLKDGEELDLDGIRIKVLATPGHTAGGVSYYFPEGGFLICGDTPVSTRGIRGKQNRFPHRQYEALNFGNSTRIPAPLQRTG